MSLSIVARSGPPEAMDCPAFLCDVCHTPLTSEDYAVWKQRWDDADQQPVQSPIYTVHRGRCDRALRITLGKKEGTYWMPLSRLMESLSYNTIHPFIEKSDVEYVAPAPSTWRLGKYARRK